MITSHSQGIRYYSDREQLLIKLFRDKTRLRGAMFMGEENEDGQRKVETVPGLSPIMGKQPLVALMMSPKPSHVNGKRCII